MEQSTLYGDLNLFSVFLWHVTFVYLIVLMFLSYIIFKNTKDRLFLLYFTYVSLLFSYIACRNYYFMEIQTYLLVHLYSYYVQVLYLCAYFYFGLAIINFKSYYPRFTKWIYRYLVVAVGIGTILFIAALAKWVPASYMEDYYYRYFFPVHITLALIIIYLTTKLKQETLRIYFLIGTISYLVLGTMAVLAYFFQPAGFVIRPIAYFYLAIVIECTFFAIGLGIRVQRVYRDKLETERRLNNAQKELQARMLLQIEQQEEDKLALLREKELQVLATQVALLENKVLRSQMNSHFIFNVLNSIKAYIIEQDSKKAIGYLNKFAKLMRRVLDSSRQDNHTLADELSAIKLYLDIERMRLPEQVSVIVDLGISPEQQTIIFPSLLMQPFVENAIWHGLTPSQREKELTIRIREEGAAIVIDILDNGVGYFKSLADKSDLESHRSHGISITNERIIQFNQKHAIQLSFGIEDRLETTGTRVWIRIETH